MAIERNFIINQEGEKLLDRFKVLIKDTDFFDVLVGYFNITGFHLIYDTLKKTKKIRILVGMQVDETTSKLVQNISNHKLVPAERKKIIGNIGNNIIKEFEEDSEEKLEVENGVEVFLDWLNSGKIEMRVYPEKNIHAKLYIMTFKKGDRDIGRVITGSSNFTRAGLKDNLEFNVELKNEPDYEFAKQKFEELWEDSIDIRDVVFETITQKTWMNKDITPYELYLKALYEYFREYLTYEQEIFYDQIPKEFKKLKYQEDAVKNAKLIIERFGGVFISDVVGIGKTFIGTLLAKELGGGTLVIASPKLLNSNNPNSWPNIFYEFRVPGKFLSWGKLEEGINIREQFQNVIIDESHHFRNKDTISYAKLDQICRGKKIILISATPYNNRPEDILAQIRLFMNIKQAPSPIPTIRTSLENYFNQLENRLKSVDKAKDYDKYLQVARDISETLREKLLKYIMIRRTRREIQKYYAEDLKKANIEFPEIKDPTPFFYQLNEEENKIFDETLVAITKKLKYSRYTPLSYLKEGEKKEEEIGSFEEMYQENLGKIMKITFLKRFESSIYAFRKTLDRFIDSYTKFLEIIRQEGVVYISKKYINKIFDFFEESDIEGIEKLISEGKAEKYDIKKFRPDFIENLERDLELLQNLKKIWEEKIKRDSKLLSLFNLIQNLISQNKKIIIFTESKDTAEYLVLKLNEKYKNKTLGFTGESKKEILEKVLENFDANNKFPKDDYQILVTTEVLSEGVNLHRSNIVINYDIPWNPTRLMQRIGRVNRIGTKFKEIYVYNFFPTKQSNDQLKLKEIAESKLHMFMTLLGEDAKFLTENEPVGSHELFNKLLSKETISGEEEIEESELKYLSIIKEIQENNKDLFDKIKRIPKKSKTGRKLLGYKDHLLTFFKRGIVSEFYLVSKDKEPQELTFLEAIKLLECDEKTTKQKFPLDNYYNLLMKNKEQFEKMFEEEITTSRKLGAGHTQELIKTLHYMLRNEKWDNEDEEYLNKIKEAIYSGKIPSPIIKEVNKEIRKVLKEKNYLKILNILKTKISKIYLEKHLSEYQELTSKREIILSEYFV